MVVREFPGGVRQIRFALLLPAILLLMMTGCGDSADPSAASPADPVAGPVDPSPSAPAPITTNGSSRPGAIQVTVDEGTNLSFALHPNGQSLVLSIQGVLFSLPVTGGSATPLTGYYHDAREPTFSPDGSRIAFHGYRNGTWDLWVIPADGGEPAPLTDDPFDDREARYSPEGAHIAFSSDRGGNYDIWLYALSDGSLTKLTSEPVDEYSPAWSPDGREFAYVAALDRRAEVRRTELATGITRVVTQETGTVSGLAWHPDGTHLTYQRTTPVATELKQVALESGESTLLSHPDDDVFPLAAAWLDREILLYAANGVINRQSKGADRDRIPFTAAFELERPTYPRRRRDHDDAGERSALGLAQPAISPDGERITFTALGDIWLWSPAAGELENLTNSPFAERAPRFSPDGNRIAYISDRSADGGEPAQAVLWTYHIPQGRHTAVPLAGAGVTNPSWSPDGSSVAVFTSIPDNPLAGQLQVVGLEDGSLTPVGPPMPPQAISWSPDGQYVAATRLAPYSSRYREGVYRLIVTSPTTGEHYEVEPVAHKNMISAALAPLGQALTYVQDGQLWRQELTEDFQPSGYPEPLTAQLTDSPSWSTGGKYLVFLNGDQMLRLDVDTGETTEITPHIPWRPDQPLGRWTILIGRLFDGTGDAYLENALLTIQGNRIKSIETGVEAASPDVDASEAAAFPGLFEMHAHLGETSESQGRAWLAYGITSVRDPGAEPYTAKQRQEIWDSGRMPGPRTHITGYLADGNRVYYPVAEGIGSDVHLQRALDRVKRLQLDFIKTYVRLPDHRQKRVVDFAHGIGIPVSSHELFPAVAHGMDHVEHIGGTSRRGYQPKVSALGRSYQDVVRLLAQSGMGITPTAVLPGYAVVAANEPDLFDTPQFEHFYGNSGRQAAAMLLRMVGEGAEVRADNNGRLLRNLANADALLVTGTDSPFVPYGAGLHAELRLYARAGLAPAQILRAAAAKSAQATAVDHDIGTLQPGMIADFVVVDGDPLADIRDADNVVLTVKNGRAYRLEQLLQTPTVEF